MLLSFVTAARAQDPLCPRIDVIGPNGLTTPGDTLTFAVTLSSTPANVRYFWKVSRGTILAGQGTQSAVVRSSMAEAGQNIVATISIEGLPAGCNADASETAPIVPLLDWEAVDEWGRLPNNDQRGRLDNFFQELANNPHDYGLFYISVQKKEGSRALYRKMAFVLDHAKFRKFDKSRFIFALTDWDRHGIRLYRYRPGQWPEIDCKPPCKLIYGRDLK